MAKKKSKKAAAKQQNNNKEELIMVDPARIRFQHARIRPVFSGCGRSVTATLDQIRAGQLAPSDLPPIQVLVGTDNWYFSLNNRRLWVLKRCREEGLLDNNQIAARVRKPKSEQEVNRYTLENCALEAKIMPEKPKTGALLVSDQSTPNEQDKEEIKTNKKTTKPGKESDVDDNAILGLGSMQLAVDGTDSDDDSDDDEVIASNRFSAFM